MKHFASSVGASAASGARLPFRQLSGGTAAKQGVVRASLLGAAGGDEAAEPGAKEARHAQDGWVGEQVLEEGAHRLGPVEAAEVEQYDGDTRSARGQRRSSTSRLLPAACVIPPPRVKPGAEAGCPRRATA